jgi:hypothetical protein
MNNGPFTTFTGCEVRTIPAPPFPSIQFEVADTVSGDCRKFATLMDALCYAENVDRARDLSAEALAYFNASGVLVD